MHIRARFVLAVLACSLAFAQAETYIVTPMPPGAWKVGKGQTFALGAVRSYQLGRLEQELERRYREQGGFTKTFMDFLKERLGKSANPKGEDSLSLDLVSLGFNETFVPEHAIPWYLRGGGPHYGPQVVPAHYDIRWQLKFRLMKGEEELLKGSVLAVDTDNEDRQPSHNLGLWERTYEYNLPGRLKLSPGLRDLQDRLADFIAGRTSASHVTIADDPKP